MVRTKMAQSDRAKQFMPFAALKGYTEALQEKERIFAPKAELAEEYQQELNRRLQQIKKGDTASVTYFHRGEYLKRSGIVSQIDVVSKVLTIANTEVAFDAIYNLSSDKTEGEERNNSS